MCSEALVEDPTLPLLEGHLVGGNGDSVPQCLHVVDLFGEGEIIEARWGHRQWTSHDESDASIRWGACRGLEPEYWGLSRCRIRELILRRQQIA